MSAPPPIDTPVDTPRRWLGVVGIGEAGLDGLSPLARGLIGGAELLVGGARHLAMLPGDERERLQWSSPIAAMIDAIAARRGRRVCVLATGDPMHYGIGAHLARRIPPKEIIVVPAPSAFSLVAARLGWPLAEVDCLTVHGRPLALVEPFVQPDARLIVLADDGIRFDGRTMESQFNKIVYPKPGHSPVHMLYRYGGAILGTLADTNRYVEMYKSPNLEFVVNQSIWDEGDTCFADIILPACTNFERFDIGEWTNAGGYAAHFYTQLNHRVITFQHKCIEPLEIGRASCRERV